jgi:hypothetical protein
VPNVEQAERLLRSARSRSYTGGSGMNQRRQIEHGLLGTSGVVIIITHARKIDPQLEIERVFLEEWRRVISPEPQRPMGRAAARESLAYRRKSDTSP